MQNTIRVQRYRVNRRQEDVARAIEVTTATINQIENGKYIPNLMIAMRLARYFNIPVEQLFIWEDSDTAKPREDDEIKLPPL